MRRAPTEHAAPINAQRNGVIDNYNYQMKRPVRQRARDLPL